MTDGYKSMHRNAIWFGCLADWICSVGGMAEGGNAQVACIYWGSRRFRQPPFRQYGFNICHCHLSSGHILRVDSQRFGPAGVTDDSDRCVFGFVCWES